MPGEEVCALKTIGYENGNEILDFESFSINELDEIRLEIEKLFSGKNLVARYYDCDCNGDSAFHVECWDEDDNDWPIPDEWLKKILTFGHPKKEKHVRLVGDRIPITVTGRPTFEVRFVDCQDFH